MCDWQQSPRLKYQAELLHQCTRNVSNYCACSMLLSFLDFFLLIFFVDKSYSQKKKSMDHLDSSPGPVHIICQYCVSVQVKTHKLALSIN